MVDGIGRIRETLRRASETADDRAVREQLQSLDEGLMEMTTSDGGENEAKTRGDVPRGDDLEEVEAELARLLDATDGVTHERLQAARDALDEYRQEYTRDW